MALGVLEQVPPLQSSSVHSLPSSQLASSLHTHVWLEESQNGIEPEHCTSVQHSTQSPLQHTPSPLAHGVSSETAVPWQLPPEQVSSVVQASPSSHESVLSVFTQPVAGSQESEVQALLSSQLIASLMHSPVPILHESSVQASLSSQSAGLVHGSVMPITEHVATTSIITASAIPASRSFLCHIIISSHLGPRYRRIRLH
jgi:hypothetical protein